MSVTLKNNNMFESNYRKLLSFSFLCRNNLCTETEQNNKIFCDIFWEIVKVLWYWTTCNFCHRTKLWKNTALCTVLLARSNVFLFFKWPQNLPSALSHGQLHSVVLVVAICNCNPPILPAVFGSYDTMGL